ncbi:MAG: penicillin-binding protein 2 [Azospirillaceae bacterium]|nr:penicillin-binding protein 2 [Azospirillaceae bacterium]
MTGIPLDEFGIDDLRDYRRFLPATVAHGRPQGREIPALTQGRARLVVTAAIFCVAVLVICARLVDVMVLQEATVTRLPHAASTAYHASRADIVDRNGVLLATSLATASLYADPKLILNVDDAVNKLTRLFPDLDRAELTEKLKSDKRFVWIKRNLTPHQHQQVFRLGLPGLDFEKEERRIFPTGSLLAHVVGLTGVDNHGMVGIESSYDKTLRGGIEPLHLSIDVRLQHIMRTELQASIDEFKALGGAGIIMDVNTGEVLSLLSLPDFDPQNNNDIPPDAMFNRATLGTYELGSVFKIFNSAMALDSGRIHLDDTFDTIHPIQAGRHTIKDYEKMHRWLSLAEIFQYSSNIGSVRIVQQMGIPAQRAFLDKVGLTTPSPIELPEVGAPQVPNPWREVNSWTIAFGHGIAVSPMQLAAAAASTINGGIYHPPTLVQRDPALPVPGHRVISPETSDKMRRLFRLVVTSGTASFAKVPGYVVGGKTGTADKVVGHGYGTKANRTTFVGVFPMNNPRYLVLALIDEPHADASTHGFATAGWIAVPVVGRVIKQMGPLVGIEPVNEDSPEIHQALDINARPRSIAGATP